MLCKPYAVNVNGLGETLERNRADVPERQRLADAQFCDRVGHQDLLRFGMGTESESQIHRRSEQIVVVLDRFACGSALPMHSSATVLDTRICSGSAWAQSRKARFTVDPNKSLWCSIGSPAATPIRTRSGCSGCSLRCCSRSLCTLIAQRIAAAAETNAAMIPSPVCFTSLPLVAISPARTMRS